MLKHLFCVARKGNRSKDVTNACKKHGGSRVIVKHSLSNVKRFELLEIGFYLGSIGPGLKVISNACLGLFI